MLHVVQDPVFREAVDENNERVLDNVEQALYANIVAKNITAIIFHLKCKGKKRGYIERSEIEHSGKIENLNIDVTKLNDDELRAIIARADNLTGDKK